MDFLEEAQVVRCEFCASSLLVAGRSGVLRYVVPEKIRESREAEHLALAHVAKRHGGSVRPGQSFLFYAPFWRMKGKAYRWVFGQKTVKLSPWSELDRTRQPNYGGQGYEDVESPSRAGLAPERRREKELLARAFDHTIPGTTNLDVGLPTLGIRVQALQLRPLEKEDLEKRYSFLPLTISPKQAREGLEQSAQSFLNPSGFEAEITLPSFVGKSLAVIYFPLWYIECRHAQGQEVIIVDAVGKAVLKTLSDGSAILEKLKGEESRKTFTFSEIRFLPFRCPNCGWDFPFYPFSRIHFCPNCRRLYRETGGEWKERSYTIPSLPREEISEEIIWLPFWRSRAVLDSGDRRLSSMADLFSLIPPLRVFDPAKEARRPINFYLPALQFRNPQVAHKLASRLTFLQPEIASQPFPDDYRPCTTGGSLAEADFMEMGPIILGEMIPPGNRKILGWLKGCRVELQDPQILYFPFTRSDLYWKELATGIAFQHNAGAEDMPDVNTVPKVRNAYSA